MSELTATELAAGISRRALATFQRRNSANGHDNPLAKPESLGEYLAGKAIGDPEKTPVIDTWNRNVDIINLSGWHFSLRETTHTANSVHVVEMFFRRPELELIAKRILGLLRDSPAKAHDKA